MTKILFGLFFVLIVEYFGLKYLTHGQKMLNDFLSALLV